MTIEIDKITHALACYGIALTVGMYTTWWAGLAAALAIGALKEGIDFWSGKGSPEWADFIADSIGAAMGAAVIIVHTLI